MSSISQKKAMFCYEVDNTWVASSLGSTPETFLFSLSLSKD